MQKDYKIVILTGMPGSGKTSTGRELARILQYDFLDLDEIIEKKYGKISDIFKNRGENYFRQIETKELKNLEEQEEIVLSLGGGTILKNENLEILKKLGRIFYLEAKAGTIFERIKNESHRPLLNTPDPKKTIEQTLEARREKYEKSGEKIETDGKSAKEAAGEIYEKLMR